MNKSVMWDYIAQEPEVLTGLLADQSISEYAERIAPELEAVYFVAHGSSYNATIAVADFFASQTGLRVYAYTPANFLYKTSLLRAEHPLKTLIIAVSQTGTSSGVLTALRKARELGLCTLGITGINEAPIKQFAEDVLMLRCGL